MTINQLINQLKELQKIYGDVTVHINDRHCNEVKDVKFYKASETYIKKLPDRLVLDQY